jgi:hypothetical protein
MSFSNNVAPIARTKTAQHFYSPSWQYWDTKIFTVDVCSLYSYLQRKKSHIPSNISARLTMPFLSPFFPAVNLCHTFTISNLLTVHYLTTNTYFSLYIDYIKVIPRNQNFPTYPVHETNRLSVCQITIPPQGEDLKRGQAQPHFPFT